MTDEGFSFCGGTQSYDIGQGDAWLVRTDINGTITWNHTIGDTFGNTAVAFVYEGNETYTIAGKTLRQGESYEDIWIFKLQVLMITPTINPTEPNSYPAIIFATSAMLLTVFIRFLIKNKKLKI